jgi:hypothetical protein
MLSPETFDCLAAPCSAPAVSNAHVPSCGEGKSIASGHECTPLCLQGFRATVPTLLCEYGTFTSDELICYKHVPLITGSASLNFVSGADACGSKTQACLEDVVLKVATQVSGAAEVEVNRVRLGACQTQDETEFNSPTPVEFEIASPTAEAAQSLLVSMESDAFADLLVAAAKKCNVTDQTSYTDMDTNLTIGIGFGVVMAAAFTGALLAQQFRRKLETSDMIEDTLSGWLNCLQELDNAACVFCGRPSDMLVQGYHGEELPLTTFQCCGSCKVLLQDHASVAGLSTSF